MGKKEGIFFILFLLISFVSAEISISEPHEIYNLGDKIYIDLNGLKGAGFGNLNINLVCGNNSVNLVKIPARAFSGEEEQSYSVPYKILNKDDLEITDYNEILGPCQIIASLGSETATSKSFTITNSISLTASTDKTIYNPGETVNVDIRAVKANGDLLNGFIEGANATAFNKVIEGGAIKISFSIPETAEAGVYHLNLHAYDSDDEGILNEGNTELSYEVNQVPTSIVLSLSDEEATPGSDFSIGAEVFDQSGKKMEGIVALKLRSPLGKEISATINKNEPAVINFPFNATAGTWIITAYFENATDQREFEMKEIQKAKFDFEGPVLTIKNIGNTEYNKTIIVNIGNETRELKLKIAVGETRKFNLKAPKGEYDVKVTDGEEEVSHQVMLTGNAISLRDLSQKGFLDYSLLWIFIILILAGVGVVLVLRYKKTKILKEGGQIGEKKQSFKEKLYELKHLLKKKKGEQNIAPPKKSKIKNEKIMDLTKTSALVAEQALVLKGEKHPTAVIAIKLKGDISPSAGDSLKKIIESVVGTKGAVNIGSDSIIIILSPLITKTYNNELLASKISYEILVKLREYNKKFKDKIGFGIGINSGELVASKEGNKLKYTQIGSTISFAKKLSETADSKILVSDSIRKKMLRDLKVIKAGEINKSPIYEVSEIRNQEANKAKLQELLKRMNQNK